MIGLQHIFLEGSDLAGKSTTFKSIWRELQENKNYSLFLSDRSYFSILCYGEYYNRYDSGTMDNIHKNFFNFLNNNNIVFYLKLDKNMILNRYLQRGDDDRSIDDILKIKCIYDLYANYYSAHPSFVTVDVNNMSVSEITKFILTKLDTINSNTIYDKINIASDIIDNYGIDINGTKELINYEIFHTMQIDEISDCFIKREHLLGIIDDDFINLEIDSYDYQISRFNKKIESVLSGYYGKKEGLESRKFVFTDDECLSYFHILVRDDRYFINVNFRSSNIKLLSIDIKSILLMIYNFNKKNNFKNIKSVNINIKFDSLHKYLTTKDDRK